MKRITFFLLIIQIMLLRSCEFEFGKRTLDDSIQAGQKTSIGVEYFDLEPDIHCKVPDAFDNPDTIFYLDLNKDGIDDFTVDCSMESLASLGGDREIIKIKPLTGNAVCVDPVTNWLDTIPYMDTISAERIWSSEEALIYYYSWTMGEDPVRSGLWKDVTVSDKYYVGFKISESEKTFFGWIGMRRDSTASVFNYILTDYAILKEYRD